MPIAVDPSLMASREYSTWKRRPSGEKVLYTGEHGHLEQGMDAIEGFGKTYLMPRSIVYIVSKCSSPKVLPCDLHAQRSTLPFQQMGKHTVL